MLQLTSVSLSPPHPLHPSFPRWKWEASLSYTQSFITTTHHTGPIMSFGIKKLFFCWSCFYSALLNPLIIAHKTQMIWYKTGTTWCTSLTPPPPAPDTPPPPQLPTLIICSLQHVILLRLKSHLPVFWHENTSDKCERSFKASTLQSSHCNPVSDTFLIICTVYLRRGCGWMGGCIHNVTTWPFLFVYRKASLRVHTNCECFFILSHRQFVCCRWGEGGVGRGAD